MDLWGALWIHSFQLTAGAMLLNLYKYQYQGTQARLQSTSPCYSDAANWEAFPCQSCPILSNKLSLSLAHFPWKTNYFSIHLSLSFPRAICWKCRSWPHTKKWHWKEMTNHSTGHTGSRACSSYGNTWCQTLEWSCMNSTDSLVI